MGLVEIDKAKNLILKFGCDKIYTDIVKLIGNSAHINCKKEFDRREVVVFILKKKVKRK